MAKLSTLLCLTLAVLTGCAQIFDGNLYSSVDKPNLSSMNLGSMSLADLRNYMHDDSFLTALRSDDASLASVVTNLTGKLSAASSAADKIQVLQTEIIILGLGSKAYYVANNMLNFVSSNVSGLGSSATSLQSTLNSVFPTMSTTDKNTAIQELMNLGILLYTMQFLSASQSDFYTGLSGADCGTIAQVGIMAAFLYTMYIDSPSATSVSTATTNVMTVMSETNTATLTTEVSAFTGANGGAGLSTDFSNISNAMKGIAGTYGNLKYVYFLSTYLKL